MRTAILILLFLTLNVFAQFAPVTSEVYRHTPIRRIGTNIIDFSPMIDAVLKSKAGTNARNYFIAGEITQITPEGVLLECDLGIRYQIDTSDALNASPQELLRILAVKGMLDRSNGKIGLGDYLALSPQARSYLKPVRQRENILLTNCPADLQELGNSIKVFAWPLGQFSDAQNVVGTIRRFDYGEKFSGSTSNYPGYYRINNNGIVFVRFLVRSTNSPPTVVIVTNTVKSAHP